MSLLLKSFKTKRGLRRFIGPKRIVVLFVLLLGVIWVWDQYNNGNLSPEIIRHYRIHHPILAVFLFVLVYAVSVIFTLPTLPLNLAAGFFWGGVLGGIYTAVGVTIGGWISFLVARFLIGQPLAKKFDNNLLNFIQNEFKINGWKFLAFIRINPIIPTGPLNYLLGLTSITNRLFVWTTFVFLIPPSIAMAYIGETLQTFSLHQSAVKEAIRVFLGISGAVTALFAIRFMSRLLKKKAENL